MMDFQAARALVTEVNWLVHGREARVTRPAPDDQEISTRVVWMTAENPLLPTASETPRRDAIRLLAIRRVDVPTCPRGTTIIVREWGAAADQTWRVDGMVEQQPDHFKVAVIEAEDV